MHELSFWYLYAFNLFIWVRQYNNCGFYFHYKFSFVSFDFYSILFHLRRSVNSSISGSQAWCIISVINFGNLNLSYFQIFFSAILQPQTSLFFVYKLAVIHTLSDFVFVFVSCFFFSLLYRLRSLIDKLRWLSCSVTDISFGSIFEIGKLCQTQ